MFGYVIPNQSVMTPEQQDRYRSAYCGLCRRIGALHGLRGRLTLSYDLTFLDLLLCSLYEGDTPALTGPEPLPGASVPGGGLAQRWSHGLLC